MLDRIVQILDDLFGIPDFMVEKSDDLELDWGMTLGERLTFNKEVCAEFNIPCVPTHLLTIQDYVDYINDKS